MRNYQDWPEYNIRNFKKSIVDLNREILRNKIQYRIDKSKLQLNEKILFNYSNRFHFKS
jgi:hypothetical protein